MDEESKDEQSYWKLRQMDCIFIEKILKFQKKEQDIHKDHVIKIYIEEHSQEVQIQNR